MSNAWPATLKVGDLSVNSQCSGDLGNSYSVGNSTFQLFQTNSLVISAAAGKLLQRLYTNGVPTGKVIECITANSLDICGVVPSVNITSTTTISGSTWLLAVVRGPTPIQVNTTTTAGLFSSSGTAGGAQSIDSSIGLLGAIVGQTIQTTAASVANLTVPGIVKIDAC